MTWTKIQVSKRNGISKRQTLKTGTFYSPPDTTKAI